MLTDFLQAVTFWYWLILGVFLMMLEMLAPGVAFLWIGVAGLITGVALWLAPDLSVQVQVIFFAVVAIISVIAGRTWLKHMPVETDQPGLNRRSERYIGQRFTLSEPIQGGVGRIKMDDTTWKVSGADMEKGAHIEVVGIDGATLNVERRD